MIDELELIIPRTPPSVNNMAVGGQRAYGRYYRVKREWQDEVGWLLRTSSVLRPLPGVSKPSRVEATAELRFPDRRRRDAGNYGAILEKVVGDALVELEMLADDDHTHYRWTSVTFDPERGSHQTTLQLRVSRAHNFAQEVPDAAA